MLLSRDPAEHVLLDDFEAVARLLNALRKAGAYRQIAMLIECLPAAGILGRQLVDYPVAADNP